MASRLRRSAGPPRGSPDECRSGRAGRSPNAAMRPSLLGIEASGVRIVPPAVLVLPGASPRACSACCDAPLRTLRLATLQPRPRGADVPPTRRGVSVRALGPGGRFAGDLARARVWRARQVLDARFQPTPSRSRGATSGWPLLGGWHEGRVPARGASAAGDAAPDGRACRLRRRRRVGPRRGRLVGIKPSTVKRHLAHLRARSGLTTEQLIYSGRALGWLVVPSLEPA